MPRVPSLPCPLPLRRAARDLRRLIARRPWVYWFAVGALGAWAYSAVSEHTAAADRARSEWGATTPVVVATADVGPGDPLTGSVAARQWPLALAPPDALEELPTGAIARQHVAAGDVLGTRDVAPDDGPLALVPEGWMVAPVTERPASGAAVGDRVRVSSEGVVLADEALVVGFVDSVTLVATAADIAPLLPAAPDVALLRVP